MSVVAFLAPRYHTNQVGWVQLLRSEGHDVEFGTLRRAATEDSVELVPRVLVAEGLPTVSEIGKWLADINASELVIRGEGTVGGRKGTWLYRAFLAARLAGIRPILYSQSSCRGSERTGFRREGLRVLMAQFAKDWISPVDYRGRPLDAKYSYNRTFLPFVASKNFYESEIDSHATMTQAVRVLAVGKFRPRKQHIELVNALGSLGEERRRRIHLSIVGGTVVGDDHSYLAKLKDRIKVLGLEENVSLFVEANFNEMPMIMRNHHVLIHNARKEPASVSIIEALAAGRAVICRSDGGTSHYVRDAQAGIVLDDEADLQIALKRLADDPTKIGHWSLRGRSYALAQREFARERWRQLVD